MIIFINKQHLLGQKVSHSVTDRADS